MPKPLLRTQDEIEKLYLNHNLLVYRICRTYMKNIVDTEDAVADTFVKLIRFAPQFENSEHEKAWLIRTAANVCKDLLKSRQRKMDLLSDYNSISDTADIDQCDATLAVVYSLPEKYKIVVLLYYYEGYTTVEISDILHKPNATVRYLLYQARKILKEKLGGDFQ